jgi:hypothetical protein
VRKKRLFKINSNPLRRRCVILSFEKEIKSRTKAHTSVRQLLRLEERRKHNNTRARPYRYAVVIIRDETHPRNFLLLGATRLIDILFAFGRWDCTNNTKFVVGVLPLLFENFIPILGKGSVCINLQTKLFVSKDLSCQTPRKHRPLSCMVVHRDESDLFTSWTFHERLFLEHFHRIFTNRSLFESVIDTKFVTVFFNTPLILK